MGFLFPAFLIAAAAVAVPILIHLLHLRSGKRQPFPALRYLRRTEKEHARRIRLRQLLLLLLRAAAIVLLVAAGARLFIPDQEGDHDPTAVAIVLDNSVSSGAVIGEARVLDVLKERALETVGAATAEDRIWVIRAGEPWDAALPLGPAQARRRIEETEPRGSSSDLANLLSEARSLVASANMPAAEVHLLSDLQESSLPPAGADETAADADVPVLVAETGWEPPANRFVSAVSVGGGLPPVENETTEITARVDEAGDGAEGDTVRLRLVIGEQITSAADAPIGTSVVVPTGPFSRGPVAGRLEIDPDALRADDRRYFAIRVRPPPRVGVSGDPGRFVFEALQVLEESGRIAATEPVQAEVVVAHAGEGLQQGFTTPSIILPSDDPALLTATNNRLRQAGIPWSLETDADPGEELLEPVAFPLPLEEIRAGGGFRLVPRGEIADSVVHIRTATGSPWMVSGTTPAGGSYLLLASPLVSEATSLPLSTEMVPAVEWMVSGWPPGFQERSSIESGESFPVPADATLVVDPDGTEHPVDGRQPFRSTGIAGIYSVFAGDSVVDQVAVNHPPGESLLASPSSSEIAARLGTGARILPGDDQWAEEIFLERRGSEPWRFLLAAIVLLLVGESLMAAGGGGGARRAGSGSPGGTPGASTTAPERV